MAESQASVSSLVSPMLRRGPPTSRAAGGLGEYLFAIPPANVPEDGEKAGCNVHAACAVLSVSRVVLLSSVLLPLGLFREKERERESEPARALKEDEIERSRDGETRRDRSGAVYGARSDRRGTINRETKRGDGKSERVCARMREREESPCTPARSTRTLPRSAAVVSRGHVGIRP